MQSFKEFKEKAEKEPVKGHPTSLHSFDLDDTLFESPHMRVHVIDPIGNRVRSLTTQEYTGYRLPEGHRFDFGEFRSSEAFSHQARPIRKMLAKLKALKKNPKNKVEILTARSDLDDQPKFAHHMKRYGIDIDNDVHVRRAGNLPMKAEEAKAAIVNELIKQHGYKSVHLYDDSPDNLEKFLKLKKQNPDVTFNAHHVVHDHDTGVVSVHSRKI